MSSSVGKIDANASGLEKDGVVSIDIFLREARVRSLGAADVSAEEPPAIGGLTTLA